MRVLAVLALLAAVSAKKDRPVEQQPSDFTESGEELWYVPGFYNKDLASEITYLQGQCDVMWVREKEIFDKYLPAKASETLNENNPLIVADIGCGPGATSTELLRAYPGIHVHCVDVQQDFLNHAAKLFAKVAPNRGFTKRGTVLNTTLASGFADVVLTRLTLQHIPKLDEALLELNRVLKPGGRLVIVDTDESMGDHTYPRVEAVEELTTLHSELRGHRSHGQLSLHLWDWLDEAGFNVVRYDTGSVHSRAADNIQGYEVINHPNVYHALSKKGIVKKARVERAIGKQPEERQIS